VVAPVPAYADTLPCLPIGDTGSHCIDDASHLVAGHAGELESGPKPFHSERIAVADSAGLHFDANLAGAWLGDRALDYLETCASLRDLRGLHGCDGNGCSHRSSSGSLRVECSKNVVRDTNRCDWTMPSILPVSSPRHLGNVRHVVHLRAHGLGEDFRILSRLFLGFLRRLLY